MVHPESPASVVAMADVVGSTSQLIKAACEMDNQAFIVATDKGIFYKMQQLAPGENVPGSTDGGVWCNLPQLRSLPVDGHEWPAEYAGGAGR